jgi:hypothetical protein
MNVVQAMKLTVLALLLLSLSLAHTQPPPNDDCANAIVVDPNSLTPIYGDNTLAVSDGAREAKSCFVSTSIENGNGLWYKFTSSALAEVTPTVCNNGTTANTVVSVFVGNDCNSLSCVNSPPAFRYCSLGPPDYIFTYAATFLTEPNKTYWILAQGIDGSKGSFNLTLSTSPTKFILLNPIVDRRIELLNRFVSYFNLPTSRLNIEATFSSNPKSVRVTFDDPPRDFCENTPPFTVFGDLNGDYFNATIPVGEHLVTATPYNLTKCQGSAGPSQNQSFLLDGCWFYTTIIDVAYNVSVGYNYFGLSYLPCSLNIEVIVQCGFSPKEVKLEVRNTVTNTLLVSRVELAAPYYLFGDVKGKPLSGALPPGKYRVDVIVDGIDMGSNSFVFSKECAKNIPPNDACSNATSFVLDSRVPFRAIGDTTFAVLDIVTENSCDPSQYSNEASGLWYKFRTPPAPFLSKIVASTCSNVTNFDARINVFVGNDCSNLTCPVKATSPSCSNAQGSSIAFLGKPNQMYWILVKGESSQSGVFQLTVESNPNVFVFVDPVSDGPISLLQDASYTNLPVSQLNIQALYDPALPTPKSVRLTFDNPARNSCENSPPFSVFGDLNGDYLSATIPVGNHTVTATPYNTTNCGGTAGPTQSESFSLEPCSVYAAVVDVTLFEDVGIDFLGQLDYLPCSVNVGAAVSCGFVVKEVKLELRNTDTNTLLVTRTERAEPYYLFGDLDSYPLAGELPPGRYQFKIIVNGIEMYNFEFAASQECV